jgi:hypothetical protein
MVRTKLQHRAAVRLGGLTNANQNNRLCGFQCAFEIFLHLKFGDRQDNLSLQMYERGIVLLECPALLEPSEGITENAYYIGRVERMLHD